MATKKKDDWSKVDRWTSDGHGIVNVSKNTPEQQKVIDEINAKAKAAKKKPAGKPTAKKK